MQVENGGRRPKHVHKWKLSSLKPYDIYFACCDSCPAIVYNNTIFMPTKEAVSDYRLKWGEEEGDTISMALDTTPPSKDYGISIGHYREVQRPPHFEH